MKAVVFDFGETLFTFGRINPVPYFRKAAKLTYKYLRDHGQPVAPFEFYFWRNFAFLYYNRVSSRLRGNDFDSLELLSELGTRAGIKLTEQQWKEFVWLWYEPLRQVGKAEPDIKETLTKLRDSGIKLGILSNTFVHGHCLERHLEEEGILDFFPVRLYSYEYDYRKPDSRIFRAAAEKIGEKCEDIMYVGDRIDKDIEPTMKLGMHAVLKRAYTNKGKKLPTGAHQVENLSELPGIIEKINSLSCVKGNSDEF